jgi:uncharacterized protein YbjT (DUF2867 family)
MNTDPEEAKMDNKRTYVVTGATGHIGNPVTRGLLEHGHAVRALGRNRERLRDLVDLGATPFVGDMRDGAFVEELFQGADAALLVAQGNRAARDYRGEFSSAGSNYANAAKVTNLKYAVFISSLGAHDDRNRGLILIHSDVEHTLNEVDGLNVVHVRAPAFFENLFYFLQPMRERGVLSSPIAPEAQMDTASTGDVAEVAQRLLTRLDFRGKSAIELHGQPGLSMGKIADIIGEALGRRFPAERPGRDADIERMVAAGMGRDFSNLMNDAWQAISRGPVRNEEPTATSRMPSTIEHFIREQLAPAIVAPAGFRSSAAASKMEPVHEEVFQGSADDRG